MPRGKLPKADRSMVRDIRIEIMVSEVERAAIDRWWEEDGCNSRSEWIRERMGLQPTPESGKLKWEA